MAAIIYSEILPDVTDWKVGAIGVWLGGSEHSWLNMQVNTSTHNYIFALDGNSVQYILLRDSIKVIGVEGYQEAANSRFEIHLEKMGSSITLSCNRKSIQTYIENDSSPVTSVALSSPPSSAALYTWVGAFILEPSSAGPMNPKPSEPNTPVINPTAPATQTPVPSGPNPNYNPS